jgi:hypothetical protein
MKEEVILRILVQLSFQDGSGVFLKFWKWLEGLGAKDRALAKCGNFWGILGEFLGYLEWLGPNRKYFLETEGPAVIFPNAQGLRQNFQEAQGPKCKMVWNYGFLRFIFQWKIWWTESTARGPDGAARVHRGSRRCRQKGVAAPCQCAARRR